jgi:pseudouridine synthase
MKLIKYLTDLRVDSRRKIKELILDGKVEINGKTVFDSAYQVNPKDKIKVKGKKVGIPPRRVYLLLNKPRGYLTAVSDNQGRRTIYNLLPYELRKLKVYPAGRLDMNSEGLLFITNDGDIANKILSSKFEKQYLVKVSGFPEQKKIEHLKKGIVLYKRIKTKPCKIRFLRTTKSNSWYEVILTEGKKNQIREMFKTIGHSVLKLKRVRIGQFVIKGIPLGKFKILSEDYIKKIFQE